MIIMSLRGAFVVTTLAPPGTVRRGVQVSNPLFEEIAYPAGTMSQSARNDMWDGSQSALMPSILDKAFKGEL